MISSSALAPLIRRTFGADVRVVSVDRAGDWAVARVQLAGANVPSVAVKWVRSAETRSDPRQLITESVGLQFAGEHAPGLVPRVLATAADDHRGGILLLEDLSPRIALDGAIRANGAAATTTARSAFARAMGRLAATTTGRDRDFRNRLGTAASVDPDAGRLRVLGLPWARQRAMINSFGVQVPAAAEAEMSSLGAYFAEPGPFLTLSNGDMATNNFMIDMSDQGDGRLIDFEFAHFDHALAHVANFYVPGPPWMVINDPIADDLERQYRAELATGVPQADDDRLFHEGVAAGCMAMAFERCGNLPKMDHRPAGDQSRTQRVITLEAAAREAERRGHWPALTDLLRDLAATLRHRWPDVTDTIASLPPYAPRG